MTLFAELKRRNVFRVAAAYIVLSWLLLQVTDVVAPVFDLPDSAIRMIFFICALGFIPALIFSWVYELTPEGVKKESEVDRTQSITPQTGRKLDIVVIVLAVAAIGLFGLDRAGVFGEGSSLDRSGETPSAGLEGDRATSWSVPGGSPADEETVGDTEPSGVAILPFDNLSTDEENAFFASGIHEDILTYLSRAQDLRIISRTSVEKYADSDLAMGEIARELGVSHIVEGSVRRAGDRVRVTVQLIEAANDRHLWADNYDRTLDDIFAIQTEIANAIVAELKAQLSGNAESEFVQLRTSNTEAYDLYLQARVLDREGNWDFGRQIEMLRQALALDPEFVSAWLLLGEACGWQVWFYNDPDGDHMRCAEEAVARVEALVPGTPEAAAARGHFLYQVERDFRGTLELLEPIAPLRPNDAQIAQRIMLAHYHLAHWEKALQLGRRALQLDPNDQSTHLTYFLILYFSGQFDEARETIEALVRRFPETFQFQYRRAQLLAEGFGNLKPALEWARQISESPPEGSLFASSVAASLLYLAGEHEESLEVLITNPDEVQLAPMYGQFLAGNNHRALGNAIAAGEAYRAAYDHLVRVMEGRSSTDQGLLSLRAQLAALTNRTDEARRYIELAQAELTQKRDPVQAPNARYDIALTLAELGDSEAAWEKLRPLIGSPPVTRWTLRLDPLLARYFGHMPEYQKLVAGLDPQI